MSYELVDIDGKRLLFVMAADAEYGPHLKARFRPLMTGVGPVEAAVSLTAALSDLNGQARLPHLVVSLGSAGSRTLEQADVYQAASVSYRDMDASAFGFERGRTPFLDLPAEVPLPFIIPKIPTARVSTALTLYPEVPTRRSTPTWWRWRPLRFCEPASVSAFR